MRQTAGRYLLFLVVKLLLANATIVQMIESVMATNFQHQDQLIMSKGKDFQNKTSLYTSLFSVSGGHGFTDNPEFYKPWNQPINICVLDPVSSAKAICTNKKYTCRFPSAYLVSGKQLPWRPRSWPSPISGISGCSVDDTDSVFKCGNFTSS